MTDDCKGSGWWAEEGVLEWLRAPEAAYLVEQGLIYWCPDTECRSYHAYGEPDPVFVVLDTFRTEQVAK